ncbi:hypothetical protein AB6A40_007665 [Gnathostoma spinigerum]|uniref:Cytochrome c oxidase assembly protein COX16 homolog, mitochondrial n=1 Tax=Gnathostoma spinigerum TaxID=75299 RepID=A0ABD6ENU0_9BILA
MFQLFLRMNRRTGSLRFLRNGLPFFSIVAGGAIALYFGQQVRFIFRKSKKAEDNLTELKKDLEGLGVQVKQGVSIETVYKEVEALDTENWENIRGPREYEDNTEYITAK